MMRINECFVLATGQSVTRMPELLKRKISDSGSSLSVNAYLKHWRMVGVKPCCHLIYDSHVPDLAAECIKIARKEGLEAVYLSESLAAPFTYWPLSRMRVAMRRRRQWRGAGKPSLPWVNARSRVVSVYKSKSFHDPSNCLIPDRATDTMPHFRGTLVTAIALAAAKWPGKDIVLCGVDLDSYNHFYDADQDYSVKHNLYGVSAAPEWNCRHHAEAARLGVHATNLPLALSENRVLPPIAEGIKVLRDQLSERGCRLLCQNQRSQLVRSGVLDAY